MKRRNKGPAPPNPGVGQQGTNYKAIFTRWQKLSGLQLARAIFDIVKGNCSRLAVQPISSNNVWGNIVKRLGFANTRLDRLWAYSAFDSNAENVKETLEQICNDAGVVFQKTPTIPGTGNRYCFCQRDEPDENSETDYAYPMVECDTCKLWFHFLCLGLDQKNFQEKDSFVCPSCEGIERENYVPLIFLNAAQIQGTPRTSVKRLTENSQTSQAQTAVGDLGLENERQPLSSDAKEVRQRSPHAQLSPEFPTRNSLQSPKRLFDSGAFNPTTQKSPPSPVILRSSISSSPTGVLQGNENQEEDSFRRSPQRIQRQPLVIHRSQIPSTSTEVTNNKPPSAVPTFSRDRDHRSFQSPLANFNIGLTLHRGAMTSLEELPVQKKKFVFKAKKTAESNVELESIPAPTDQTSSSADQGGSGKENSDDGTLMDLSEDNYPEVNLQEGESSDFGILGPFGGYQPFQIIISKKDYAPLLNLVHNPKAKDNRFIWRYPRKNWCPIFDDTFRRQCKPSILKGCTINFKDHRIYRDGLHTFLTTTARCTRKGAVVCKMLYNFFIEKEPMPNEDVKIRVEPEGNLLHDLSTIGLRRLAGPKRDEMKKELAVKIPSVVKRKIFGDENTDKHFSSTDLHKDTMEDLRLRCDAFMEMPHLKTGKLPGFIQGYGYKPFFVSMYSNRQMLLLQNYLKLSKGNLLTLDSTGRVIADLPKKYGNSKKAFYYSLVANLPGSQESPVVPILEYLTNDQTAKNNSNILHLFFRAYGENYGKDQMGFGIERIESDASKTLIACILQALEIGRTNRYLRDCWNCLQRQTKIYLVYHICRNHASRFLAEKVQDLFPADNRPPINTWCRLFLLSGNLDEWCRRVKEIIIICGKKWFTPEVDETLRNLEAPLHPDEPKLYGNEFLDTVPINGPLYVASPFSFFAVNMCRDLDIPIAPSNFKGAGLDEKVVDVDEEANVAGFTRNDYCCTGFIEYLIHHVFLYGAMFDHSLIKLNGFSTSQDTNAPVESWNRILKHDELGPQLGMKVGRFVAFEEENLKGRLEQFEHAIRRMQRRSGVRPNELPVPSSQGDDDSLYESKETDASSSEQWGARRGSQVRKPKIVSEIEGIEKIPYGVCVESPSGATELDKFINIDNVLMVLYSLWKCSSECRRFFDIRPQSELFPLVFKKLDTKLFNDAKLDLIQNIMKIDTAFLLPNDFITSELRFCRAMSPFFHVIQHCKCSKNCIDNQKRSFRFLGSVSLRSAESIPFILKRSRFENDCKKCGKKNVEVEINWDEGGIFPFLVYPVSIDSNVVIKESSFPSSIGVIGVKFTLYAYTYRSSESYFTVFRDKKKKILYNSKRPEMLEIVTDDAPVDHCISTVWYVPKPTT